LGSLLLLAVGVAMDATAVAAARGLAAPFLRWQDAAVTALFFGTFQALMPLLGWFVGARFGGIVAEWDHWFVAAVLGAIGIKMLYEAGSEHSESSAPERVRELFAWRALLALAIATSIDALAVGITLPLLGAELFGSIATIGCVTAALSFAGVYAGRKFGAALGRRLDRFGGVLLILIGLKVLFEHLSSGP
ncbi:MAG TPA: manganese efflux pump MntP family protein, partial [Polyangiaceae bacterium]|nr:manganese efflux pump MntP family protein [Polyangiaceae bacterium]